MSHQYQPTSYYDWPARGHGIFLDSGEYTYVPYDYYAGDELHNQNTVFRDSQYVTFDNTHVRFLNLSDIHIYDTSGIKIHDSGTLTLYTSASPSARKYVVDEYGRVGIGMDHAEPHSNIGESPSFDLDVKGQVGVEDYIYHNDDVDTYMLFGSDLSAHNVNVDGSINTIYPDDQDEINFRVGGIDMIQMQTRDVSFVESGVVPVHTQDHITFNKYQFDVDHVVRSSTNTGAFVVSGDGAEVVVNEDGNADTDFRVESDHEDHMLFVDTSVNRISIGDSEDTPQATLEVTNDPDSGAFDVPLVQLNSKDTDKQALDINADNIDAHVISVSAEDLTVSNMFDSHNLNSLTTGRIINLHTNSPSSDKRTLISVHNQNVDANKVRMLDINQNAISDGRETALIRTSAPDSNPLLELRNSNDAMDTPPLLNFKALKPQSANVDLGTITFEGESNNTGSPSIVYAALSARATDVEFNKFGGVLNFMVQATDSPAQLRNMLSIGGQTNDDDGVETQAEVVINEDQIDLDFRVETDITDNAFIVYGDGSEVVVNENGVDTDFRVEAHGLDPTQYTKDDGSHDDTFETHYSAKKTHALYVNAENGRVGIGHDAPSTTLHVAGSAHIEGDLWVKGVTNQLDTLVHVTSAMDIHNIGTGPTLTVTQSGAQPVATFWDMDHNDALQPALYLADKTKAGFGTVPAEPMHLSDTVQNQSPGPNYATFLLEHNYEHGGIVIDSTTKNKQSHVRFLSGGELKWQFRHPLHATSDCGRRGLRVYSWEYGGDVMTWSYTGHVGIGKNNTCPDTFLSVKEDFGDFDIRDFVASDLATIPLKLTDTSGNNNTFMTTAGLRFGFNGEEAPTIVGYDCGGDGQAGMAFITGSTLSDSPRLATNMVINSDGHVGIGRTAPSHRLSVYLGEDTTDPGAALRVVRDFTPVTTDSTNYKKVSYISSQKAPIASGVRDQGYRIALDASMYISDTDFKGTLDDARGIWARVGTYEHASNTDQKPTGTIKETRAVAVNNLRAPDTTIEAQYGIYQNCSVPSNADKDEVSNYFEGPLRIGGEAMNDMHAKLSVRTNKGAATQRALEVEGPDPNIWFADTTSGFNNGKDDYCIKWNGDYGTSGVLGFHRNQDWNTNDTTKMPHMAIDAETGQVGIGTHTPDWALDVRDVNSSVQIQLGRIGTDPTTSGTAWMGADSKSFHLGWGVYGASNDGGATTQPNGMLIDKHGNMGLNSHVNYMRHGADRIHPSGFDQPAPNLEIQSTNSTTALLRVGHSSDGSQGTGAIEVTQDAYAGGGICYNGDSSPRFINNEVTDAVVYYRTKSTTGALDADGNVTNNSYVDRQAVFYYMYNSNDVTFLGNINLKNDVPCLKLTDTTGASSTHHTSTICSDSSNGAMIFTADQTNKKSGTFMSFRLDGQALTNERMEIHSTGIAINRPVDIRNSANGAAATIDGSCHVDTTQVNAGRIGFALYDSNDNVNSTTEAGYMYFETLKAGSTAGTGERMRITHDGDIGINTTSPSCMLDINGTDAVKIPAGTSDQRPGGSGNDGETGMIRYNSTLSTFEGFGANAWGSLGGVVDTDKDTYITPEKTEDCDTLEFYVGDDDGDANKKAVISLTGMTIGTLGTLDNSLNSTEFELSVGGNIRADGDIVAFATSDVRLKDNIKAISQPLDKLSKITGCEFDWNAKQELYTGHDVGVIAHEVEEVLPEVVTTRDDGYKAVKYEKMIPLLIECIKDQQKQIDELKQQLNRS